MWVRKYDGIYVCVRLILRRRSASSSSSVRGLLKGCRKLQLERIRVLHVESRFLSLLPVSTCAHRHSLGAPSPSCITIHPHGYAQLDTRVNLRSSNTICSYDPPSSSLVYTSRILCTPSPPFEYTFRTSWGKIPTRSVILGNGAEGSLKSEYLCVMDDRVARTVGLQCVALYPEYSSDFSLRKNLAVRVVCFPKDARKPRHGSALQLSLTTFTI